MSIDGTHELPSVFKDLLASHPPRLRLVGDDDGCSGQNRIVELRGELWTEAQPLCDIVRVHTAAVARPPHPLAGRPPKGPEAWSVPHAVEHREDMVAERSASFDLNCRAPDRV